MSNPSEQVPFFHQAEQLSIALRDQVERIERVAETIAGAWPSKASTNGSPTTTLAGQHIERLTLLRERLVVVANRLEELIGPQPPRDTMRVGVPTATSGW